jgi:predicted Rossmann fold flavoprotein
MYDLIIVGAGAGGLFLASNIRSDRVLVLEKMPSAGRKLAITGGGMCNITNCDSPEEFLTHFANRRQINFLKPALRNFPTEAGRKWFEDHGLELTIREDGKVFPKDLNSRSVIDLLLSCGKQIICSSEVTGIEAKEDHFSVTTAGKTYSGRFVALTCGGSSYPNTGSDGSGFRLASSLGHTIIEPRPGLTAVKITGYPFSRISGHTIADAGIECYHQGESRRYLQARGDLLFTHDGLSGPVILNNSRYITEGDLLIIPLMPGADPTQIRQRLQQSFQQNMKRQVRTILRQEGISSNLAGILVDRLGIADQTLAGELGRGEKKELINAVSGYEFRVQFKKSFSSAMVTSGGVSLDEVNRKSMESSMLRGLYFAGEILDIDGETGGYNLQAAWSTAKLASDHLNRIL